MRLSQRVQRISPSPTMAMDARTKELVASGVDVVNFTAGQPDFGTPEHIARAGVAAIEQGFTKYTPASGTWELKEAICRKFERDNGLEYRPEEILVTVGAKHALYNIFQAILDPGDEVVIQAPYWVSYPEQVKLAAGEPVIVNTDETTGFKLTPEQLEAAITPKARALVLNSPSNPTGAVYTADELRALGEVALRHDLLILSDEIYEKLVYDGVEAVSIAALSPELKARTAVINGLSKAYSMTGWRIGYVAADRELIRAMSSLQSHSTSNPASMAQMAGIAALDGTQEPVDKMVAAFAERRDAMLERLKALPGVTCSRPSGAFYLFPNFRAWLGKEVAGRRIETVDDLCEVFLDEGQVAAVPGTGFGAPENIRFSYSIGLKRIHEGMDRIERLLRQG